ncbi:DUF3574 domain-containing protein [Paraburkholderia sp.]|uniref:DUF3574 domain-containing protein n=1 Tax=Paraburkholderia sp. TaxID=1926495 RepID=UPI003D6DAB23
MQTFSFRMLIASISFVALTACQVGGPPAQPGAAASGAGGDAETTGAAAATGASDAAPTAQALCAKISGTKEITAELLFGRDVKGRRPVSDKEIRQFLADIVTPRFPDGFTTWRTQGQWLDSDTQHVVREDSFVVHIVASGTSDTLDHLGEIRSEYIKKFRQQSVGLVLTSACASF